ncbi:MAG: hypothetical protein OHK0019_16000 [Saprospiraceae bacterium]
MQNRAFPSLVCFLLLLLISACQTNPYKQGERLYKANCANCHMDNGEGLGALIPPLAGADYLEKNREKLPCLLRYGIKDSIVVNGKIYAEAMPGAATLSDVQIANILNYVGSTWGNDIAPYRLDEVQKYLGNCAQ